MARLFGTDGVRGLANADLTPELRCPSPPAARVLAEHDRSHRPVAVVGRDPRASGEMLEAAVAAGLASAGRRRAARRRAAHPGGRVPRRRARRRPRRGDLRLAQPDAGQRHQDLRRRRAQAARRRRGRDRAADGRAGSDRPTGAAIGRVRDVADAEPPLRRPPAGGHPAPPGRAARSSSTARTAPRPVAAPEAYRRAGAEVVAIDAEPGRPEHQRRLSARPTWTGCGPRSLRARRRPGHRPRRRRRPLPRGRRRRRRRRRRPDPGGPRARHAGRGRAGRGHRWSPP